MKSIAKGLAVVVFSLVALGAHACSCVPLKSADSGLPIIFYAQITATELTGEKRMGVPVVVARYRLIEKFRGTPTKELRTITDDGLCGYPFHAGDNLIIHSEPGGWVFLCSGTRRADPELDASMFRELRTAGTRK